MEGRLPPYDIVKEAVDRARRGACAGGAADDPVLLARRSAEHDQAVVAHRPGRLRHHRHHRARRHERHRRLRPALQPQRRRPAHRVHPPRRNGSASATRSTPPRTSCSRRCARSPASRAAERDRRLPGGATASTQTAWTTRVRERRSARPRRQPGRLDLGAEPASYGRVPTMMSAPARPSRRAAASTARC